MVFSIALHDKIGHGKTIYIGLNIYIFLFIKLFTYVSLVMKTTLMDRKM